MIIFIHHNAEARDADSSSGLGGRRRHSLLQCETHTRQLQKARRGQTMFAKAGTMPSQTWLVITILHCGPCWHHCSRIKSWWLQCSFKTPEASRHLKESSVLCNPISSGCTTCVLIGLTGRKLHAAGTRRRSAPAGVARHAHVLPSHGKVYSLCA